MFRYVQAATAPGVRKSLLTPQPQLRPVHEKTVSSKSSPVSPAVFSIETFAFSYVSMENTAGLAGVVLLLKVC